MGFAAQSLLLCGFCGVSSGCWLNITVFEFVMVPVIDGKFKGVSLGTVNCTMPNLDEEGMVIECLGLVNFQKHKTCMVGLGGGSCVEYLKLYTLKSSGMFHHELTMSSTLVLGLIFFRASDFVKCLGNALWKWDREIELHYAPGSTFT